MDDETRIEGAEERAPYEAPHLTVIGTVQEATLGTAETGPDGIGLFSF
jgi:hypothetical protein